MTPEAGETRLQLREFDHVYAEYHPRVFRFCYSQLGNRALAEDVCADVFASAFAAYERRAPEPDQVGRWLFRIARNSIIDEARRRARWSALLLSAVIPPRIAVAPDDVAMANETVRAVITALASMRRRDRELIGLRVIGEMSFDEISHVVNLSPRAAEAATRRARDRLATILAAEYAIDPSTLVGVAQR